VFATEIAARGAKVTIIDADPNKNVVDWAKLPGVPANLDVIGDVGEENIVDIIEAASARSSFVVVDLEGTASLMVSYAIAMADLVIIPVQGSQLDAKQAARQIQLIRSQERVARRKIPFAVVFTKGNPALQPKTMRHIEDRFRELAVPVLQTKFYDREAFRAIFSFGGTLSSLADKGATNLNSALQNAREFTGEIIDLLRTNLSNKTNEVA
jgi:chromosome partitioning protein